ncbi:hypothetical protein GCM10010298_22010 [Streptomyces microflavus]|uniref:Uncharacterized protein n=1 Tax=Streptomyces microflavus TaxID=1919 RepID=A0A7J0D240_STRMI|nr:hypothetical protein Smic_73790 [Streptomyces microflavus]GGX57402.1 hypothetical protein GCM10010298_22010 [Streptomyces microflavus]
MNDALHKGRWGGEQMAAVGAELPGKRPATGTRKRPRPGAGPLVDLSHSPSGAGRPAPPDHAVCSLSPYRLRISLIG